jgi:flagellar basal body-associated protein FliL
LPLGLQGITKGSPPIMTILQAISALISLIVLWFKTKTEKDVEKKKKKEGLLNEAKEAIENDDTSAITDVFDRARRL